MAIMRNRRKISCAFAAVVLVVSIGCGGNPAEPTTSSGPFSQTDILVGTGAEATSGRTLTVNYTGWLYDTSKPEGKGNRFDSSLDPGRVPFRFVLGVGTVIRGWDQGVAGMRVGGTRRLIIPPDLAYGENGQGSIPKNATLVFDIELLSVL
jgi:FKBP-type peptidyl-prolyl cis-trans isomerase FkpA